MDLLSARTYGLTETVKLQPIDERCEMTEADVAPEDHPRLAMTQSLENICYFILVIQLRICVAEHGSDADQNQ
jgi:hypothetical protein